MPPNTLERTQNGTAIHSTQPNATQHQWSSPAVCPEPPPFDPEYNDVVDGDCSGFGEHCAIPSPTFSMTHKTRAPVLSKLVQPIYTSTTATSSPSTQGSTSPTPRALVQCRIPGCFEQFGRRWDRSRHEQRVHSDERPYHCQMPGCGKSYKEKSKLTDHLEKRHGSVRYQAHAMASISRCTKTFEPAAGLS